MPPPSANNSTRDDGLRSSPRLPFAPRIWSIVVALWLALVLGFFLDLRILHSRTVTHLLQKISAH